MKIKSIKKIPYSGIVYNLGVDEDESYIANGIIVHNCRCFTIPLTRYETEKTPVEVSSHSLPAGFPDRGFK